ncbi:MAG: sensor histidine kinase [Gammaproteobacteria bacterium]|nr:sensor histidine kinase [Gammaproteobacteria bacterium]
MSAVLQHLERKPRALLTSVSLAALALIGAVDYLTGFNLSFAVFYLLDIGFAAWLIGRRFALALSALSIIISVAGDWAAGAHYSSVLIPIWNALILTVVYVLVVWLLGALRAAQRELERKVDHRTTALVREIGARERLETEILEISEREQRRIGHDLHDGLCQHLTATAMAGQVLGQKLATLSLAEAKDVGEIVRLIEEGITMTRNIAHGIAPLDMESDGLITALRGLAANVSRMFKVACTLESDSPPLIEDASAATHLYRIAQEAVHNALRHGKPRQIVMSLSRVRDRAELTIEDDGTGLSDNWQGGRGLGTRIMAHRAAMIGGLLSIEPNPTGGTFVTCSFPLAPA